jgi:hypothetical protein
MHQAKSRLESIVIRLETDGSVWNRFQTGSGDVDGKLFSYFWEYLKKSNKDILRLQG